MAVVKKVFKIIVGKTNRPPVIEDIPDQHVKEGDRLTVNISSSDPDGDDIALAVSGLPPGAVFTDNGDGTGTITWIPAFGQAGEYEIEIVADDEQD